MKMTATSRCLTSIVAAIVRVCLVVVALMCFDLILDLTIQCSTCPGEAVWLLRLERMWKGEETGTRRSGYSSAAGAAAGAAASMDTGAQPVD